MERYPLIGPGAAENPAPASYVLCRRHGRKKRTSRRSGSYPRRPDGRADSGWRLQKILKALLSGFFIQAAGLAYHHRTTCGVYHPGRQAALVSHQPLWGWILLRLDDIQHFVLMICNSFGIDDIHAFGVMCALLHTSAASASWRCAPLHVCEANASLTKR